MTPAEYLHLERAALDRSEFRDGRMVPMSPSSWKHSLVADNLCRLLNNQFDGTPFRASGKTMRVRVPAAGLYAYPDALVVHGPPVLEDAHQDTLLNPCVIAEVLSDATEADDRGDKFRRYGRLPSLREYVLVCMDGPHVERFVRVPDGWMITYFDGLEATAAFETVPARVRLADLYGGVTLPEPADAPTVVVDTSRRPGG